MIRKSKLRIRVNNANHPGKRNEAYSLNFPGNSVL